MFTHTTDFGTDKELLEYTERNDLLELGKRCQWPIHHDTAGGMRSGQSRNHIDWLSLIKDYDDDEVMLNVLSCQLTY